MTRFFLNHWGHLNGSSPTKKGLGAVRWFQSGVVYSGWSPVRWVPCGEMSADGPQKAADQDRTCVTCRPSKPRSSGRDQVLGVTHLGPESVRVDVSIHHDIQGDSVS